MNIQLLVQSINSLLSLQHKQTIVVNSSIKKKLENVIKILDLKAKELDQPLSLLIKMYAYFYVNIFKVRSSSMILLKISDFFEKCRLEELPKFSDDDIELAYNLEQSWNSMHNILANDFPFQVRKFLGKSKIRIYVNTFFNHSSNFQYFCRIAKFINENKLLFPQIHSNKEFFLHLPIVTKWPKEYHIYNYLDCYQSLDKYYQMVYGINKDEKRTDRLGNYLSTLTLDSLDFLQHSKIWCRQEACEYLTKTYQTNHSTIAVV